MFKVNNKDTKTTPVASFWYLYCYIWTYFTPCSSVSIVIFEHVIAGWEATYEEATDFKNSPQHHFFSLETLACPKLYIIYKFRLSRIIFFVNNSWIKGLVGSSDSSLPTASFSMLTDALLKTSPWYSGGILIYVSWSLFYHSFR